jgi:hypothetical protein
MPRIPTILTEGSAAYAPTPQNIPQSRPSLTPVAQGMFDIADTQQRNQQLEERQRMIEAERLRREAQAEADRLAADEARVAVNGADSRMRSWITDKATEADGLPADQMPGFTERTKKEFEQYSKAEIDHLPERAKTAGDIALTNLWDQAYPHLAKLERDTRQAKVVGDFEQALEADQRTLFADHKQFDGIYSRRLAYANSLSLPEKVKQKILEQTRERLAMSAASGMVERDPRAVLAELGFDKYVKGGKRTRATSSGPVEITDPILSKVPPAQLDNLVHRAQSLVQQDEALKAAQSALYQANLRDQARGVIDDLRAGWSPKPDVMAATLKAVTGTPLEGAIKQAMALSDIEQQARTMPLPALRGEMTRLRATGDAQYRDVYERLAKVEKDATVQLKEDGFAYGTRVLGFQPPAIDWSNPEAGLSARASAARLIQKQVGQPVSPLMADEAAQYAKLLKTLPPEQQAQRLAALSTTLPSDQMQMLAGQIDPQDRALSLAMKAGTGRTTKNRFTSELILNGAAIERDRKQSPNARGDAARQQVREGVIKELDGEERGMATISGPARQDIIDSALYIYDGIAATGGRPDPAQAVGLAVGGKMVEHNSQRIPVPAGLDVDGFRNAITRYPADGIAKQAPGGQIVAPGAQPMTVQQLIAQLPTMKLDPVGYGRYHIRAGSGIALNAQGRPIVIDVLNP